MSDTSRGPIWSLERPCRLRTGGDWALPSCSWDQLQPLQLLASCKANQQVFDGIYVRAHNKKPDSLGNHYEVPCSGYRIEERFAGMGDVDAILATCQGCEANAQNDDASRVDDAQGVAGCWGYLDIWPYSKHLDWQLRRFIKLRNLEPSFRLLFPVTKPLWFGFWIQSPLSWEQAKFLHEMLGFIWSVDNTPTADELHFVHALEAAVRSRLPLHVQLSAPGHYAFGLTTELPHCPRCKADWPHHQWGRLPSKDLYMCRVCGNRYIPDQHHRCEIAEVHSEANEDLKILLGEEPYREFVRAYLLHQGCPPNQVDIVIEGRGSAEPPLIRLGEIERRELETFLSKRLNQDVGES